MDGQHPRLEIDIPIAQRKCLADAQASWWLARLSLACCAADASATKILAVGAKPLPANTWVKATGRWIPGGGTESATAIPWLQIESLESIPQPKEPYE